MKTPTESILTLEAAAAHFERWRSRKTKGEPIPETLWREAIDLLDRYRISQVTRKLRLSGSDLKNVSVSSVLPLPGPSRPKKRPSSRSIPNCPTLPIGRLALKAGWSCIARTVYAFTFIPVMDVNCWRWSIISSGSEHVATDPPDTDLFGL